MSSSDNYAGRLSDYAHKGICGLPEKTETIRAFDSKIKKLVSLLRDSQYTTILTGAGISTAAGIPDFRGPRGIWTLEEKKRRSSAQGQISQDTPPFANKKRKLFESPSSSSQTPGQKNEADSYSEKDDIVVHQCNPSSSSSSFENAKPTLTHRAITYLASPSVGKVQYCITQNVDGLHMRSGLPRDKHCFLHGCIFTEKCEKCHREYFRDFDVGGVSFQPTGRLCEDEQCKGILRDTILDWEDELPHDDWIRAQEECDKSDLVLALGTSLRIEPAGSLPTLGKRFVIVNKQETPYDRRAEVVIRANVDHVMERVMQGLGMKNWDTMEKSGTGNSN